MSFSINFSLSFISYGGELTAFCSLRVYGSVDLRKVYHIPKVVKMEYRKVLLCGVLILNGQETSRYFNFIVSFTY